MIDGYKSTSRTERIVVLDALRGFALLGIFLANIRGFSGWEDLGDQARVSLAGDFSPRVTEFLHLMLINGKFYTLFSFLFGVGFALQISRLKNRGIDSIGIFRRRLWLLLLIGILHMTFVWDGDVLALYAALGFALPAIYEWRDRKLLVGAVLLLILPVAGYWLVAMAGASPDFGLYSLGNRVGDLLFVTLVGQDIPQDTQWRYLDDWGAYWSWVLPGPLFRIGYLIESWRIPKVLGIMMLGIWAGRRLVEGGLLENRSFLKRVATVGYSIGLPANVAFASIGGQLHDDFLTGLLGAVLHALGIVPLGLAYAATFVLLWRYSSKSLSYLQAPGRMALTNYLLQSIIGIVIFYGVGFGLAENWPPQQIYLVAAAVLATQVLVSRYWLSHFRQGPMEWLWRLGTYKGHAVARKA